ncbi:unnamed protein product [marine sediment metagenome]|uniref:Uncharacterized protein n=1 Tax=marine sediment metagenome TaxID=412755 RepID=X0VS49_9ZZZZ
MENKKKIIIVDLPQPDFSKTNGGCMVRKMNSVSILPKVKLSDRKGKVGMNAETQKFCERFKTC